VLYAPEKQSRLNRQPCETFRRNFAFAWLQPPLAAATSGLGGGDAMQVSDTKLCTMDVQLLLWAVGEARDRARRRDSRRSGPQDNPVPADGADFFTEWQPATR
jgi:hypothetical protein